MQKNRIEYLDNLRFVSTLAVIFIHVWGVILYKPEIDAWWHFSNIITGSLRFCVPVFVMITGALLLGRHHNFFSFVKKNLLFRILLPFSFWYLCYFFIDPSINTIHFWYVYMLIGLYLCIPMLSDFIEKYSKTEILKISIPLLALAMINHKFHLIQLPEFVKYIPYLLLGHYLHIYSGLKDLSARTIGALLYTIGTFITIVGTLYLSSEANQFDHSLYEYLSPNVAIQSIGIFMLIKSLSFKNRLITLVNRNSFAIYLNHILIIYTLESFGIFHSMINPIIGGLTTISLTLAISIVITEIITRIPKIGHIVAGSK